MRRDYDAPGWGTGEVWVRGRMVLLHVLAGSDGQVVGGGVRTGETVAAGDPGREDHGFVEDLCRRFAAHLSGDPVAYDDVELDLDGRTNFECDLARAIRRVPWGEVVSYGELAALAGRPGAARAAGTFCARNDVGLVVPCHRVVAADGIGGYGPSGVRLKRRLLALEGVHL